MISPLARLEGKYEILEKIQEGGMGAIYKVRHLLLDETRVIKIMRPHLQQDQGLRERFLAEGRTAARLNHPNIARIYDFSIDEDGVAYLVMEFIPGWTLGDLLRRQEPLPMELCLEIARQSLDAIGHMHLHKMVHRDIAPDNLILGLTVDRKPLLKLIDLGIAKATEGASQLTAAGVFVGKFRYSAPELFDETSARNEPRSDLYSLALVLYELMTQQFPIAGTTSSSLIAGHLFRPPLEFELSDPSQRVPEPVRHALLRSLAKTPGERFANATDFAEAMGTTALDTDNPAVRKVLQLTTQPRPQEVSTLRSGGTQARLDHQFAPLPTPAPHPYLAEGSTLSASVPSLSEQLGPSHPLTRLADTDPNASTVILLPKDPAPSPAPDIEEAPTVPLPAPSSLGLGGPAAEASAPRPSSHDLFEHAKGRSAQEDFTGARSILDHLLETDPNHLAARQLRTSLDTCLEVQMEETRQTQIISRQTAQSPRPIDTAAPQAGPPMAGPPEPPSSVPQAPPTPLPLPSGPPLGGLAPGFDDEAVATPSKSLAEHIQSIRQAQGQGDVGPALQELQQCIQRFGATDELNSLRNELGIALLAQDDDQQQTVDPFGTVTAVRAEELIAIPPPGLAGPPVAGPPMAGPPMAEPPTAPTATLNTAPSSAPTLDNDLQTRGNASLLDREVPHDEASTHLLPTQPNPVSEAPRAAPAPAATTSNEPPAAPHPTTVAPPPGGHSTDEITLGGRTQAPFKAQVDVFDASLETSTDLFGGDNGARSDALPARQNQRSLLVGGILLVVLFAVLGTLLSRYRPQQDVEQLTTEDVVAASLSPGFLSLDIRPWGVIESLTDQNGESPALNPSRTSPVLLALPPGTYRLVLAYPPANDLKELTLEIQSGETLTHLEVFRKIDAKAYVRVQQP